MFNVRLIVWRFVCPLIALSSTSAITRDTIVTITQQTDYELVIFTTASALQFREDFSAPPNQIRIEVRGVYPTEAVREIQFKDNGPFSSFYILNRPGGSLIIIERQSSTGHIVCELPFSHALYIRSIKMDNNAEQELAFGIDAWHHKRYSQAMRWWTSALTRGIREAALWLGISETLQGNYSRAIDYLQPHAHRNDLLVDVYAALSLATSNPERSSYYRTIYEQRAARPLQLPSKLVLQNTIDSVTTPNLSDLLWHHQSSSIDTAQSSSSLLLQSSDTDIFRQLRMLQQKQEIPPVRQPTTTSVDNSWLFVIFPVIGLICLLIGIALLLGYHRWRRHQTEQLAAAFAHQNPSSNFDRIMHQEKWRISSSPEPLAHAQSHDELSSQVPKQVEIDKPHEDELFDFEEDVYQQHAIRKQAHSLITIDERLLYQTEGSYHLSPEPQKLPSQRELSQQEQDLLEVLASLNKELEGHDESFTK